MEHEPVLKLVGDLSAVLDSDRRIDRALLQLLIAFNACMAVSESYLDADAREDASESRQMPMWTGRRYVYYLVSAGYVVEWINAFIFLDEKHWFDEHLPAGEPVRSRATKALSYLRDLSPATSLPPPPCSGCGVSHGNETRLIRKAPDALRRLRDKGAFHWDDAAVRDAYRRVLREGTNPAILRLTGSRLRDVHSPLAASLLLSIAAETNDPESDFEFIVKAIRSLFDLIETCLVAVLLENGAEFVTEPASS